MNIHRQENHGFIRLVFTKTIFAFFDPAAFFTNHKHNANIAINTNAATSFQIQAVSGIRKKFRTNIRIL